MLKNNKLAFLLLCLVIILLVVIVIILLTLTLKKEDLPSVDQVNSYPISYNQQTQNTPMGKSVSDKIFYIQQENIYEYDLVDKTSRQLTFNEVQENGPYIDVKDIVVIDANTIGYGKCEVVSGDYGCGIYTMSLDTLENNNVKELSKDSLLLQVGFYSKTKFAYTITTNPNPQSNQSLYKFIYFENGAERVLNEVSFLAYGRGGAPEDSQKIDFSMNGQYVLQINTASPIKIFDDTIYLYDLINNKNYRIEDATKPNWQNNKEIIFRRYSEGYLYTYNLEDQSTLRLPNIPQSSSNPKKLNDNEFIFTSDGVWRYNLETNEKFFLFENAVNIIVVNSKNIVYQEMLACAVPEDRCVEVGASKLFNIDKNSSETISLKGDKFYR